MLVDAKQPGSAKSGAAAARGSHGGAVEGPAEAGSAEGLWARYASRLTGIVVRHLRADYWHLPHVRVTPVWHHSFNSPYCMSLVLSSEYCRSDGSWTFAQTPHKVWQSQGAEIVHENHWFAQLTQQGNCHGQLTQHCCLQLRTFVCRA